VPVLNIQKIHRFLSDEFFVSAEVHTSTEIPRSSNKARDAAKRIAKFRFAPYQKSPPLLKQWQGLFCFSRSFFYGSCQNVEDMLE
jgi:hypothetical protein